MSYCRKCGKKTEEDAAYCSYCGESLEPSLLQTEPSQEEPRKVRRSRIEGFAVILFIVMAIVLIFVQGVKPDIFTSQPTQTLSSSSWSGYSVSPDLKNPQAKVTGVSGTWTVPKVTPTPVYSYSAAWVGVGGQFDQTLIQIGTQHDSQQGQVSYAVWYELLPDYPVGIDELTIKPGDTITAEISLTNPSTNTWMMSISDVTTGQTYQKSVVYFSKMLSAEWIVERPTIGRRFGSLSMFDVITFTKCGATIDGRTGSITSFPSSKFIMTNRMNDPLVSVGAIGLESGSFLVTFSSQS